MSYYKETGQLQIGVVNIHFYLALNGHNLHIKLNGTYIKKMNKLLINIL